MGLISWVDIVWLISLFLFALQAFYTYYYRKRSPLNTFSTILSLISLLWILSLKMADLGPPGTLVLIVNQLAFLAPMYTSLFVFIFLEKLLTFKVPKKELLPKWFLFLKNLIFFTTIASTFLILFTHEVIEKLVWMHTYNNVVHGPLYPFYLVSVFLPIIAAIVLYIYIRKISLKTKSLALALNITRTTWFLLITILAVIGVSFTNVALPLYTHSSKYSSLGVIPLFLWLFLTNLFSKTTIFLPLDAILKKLGEIFLKILTLTFILKLFSVGSSILSDSGIASIAVISLELFNLAKKQITKGRSESIEALYLEFAKKIDREEVFETARKLLKKRLPFENIDILPIEELSLPKENFNSLFSSEFKLLLSVDVYTSTDQSLQPIYHWLVKNRIAAILPFEVENHKFAILFSKPLNNSVLTTKDLAFLKDFLKIMSTALSRALLYEQIKTYNQRLEQTVKLRTQELAEANLKLKQTLAKLETMYQAVKESDEAKTMFISIASHQLRTPISIVKNYVDMILSGAAGPLTAEQQKFLLRIRQAMTRLANLITDILQSSRLERGKFKLVISTVNLASLVQEVFEQYKDLAARKRLEYKLEITSDVKNLTIQCDKDKLFEAFGNLIDNAIHYTQQGYVHVYLYQPNPQWVIYAVKDTGIGIPKDKIHQLFKKFVRLENARRVRPDGTGIGLYLVKRIVESHGGRVWVESEVGKGSTFYIALPTKLPEWVLKNATQINT